MGQKSNNLMYGLQPMLRSRASTAQETEELNNHLRFLSENNWQQAVKFIKENNLQLNADQLEEFQISKIRQELQCVAFDLNEDYRFYKLQDFVQPLYQFHKASADPSEKSVLASILEEENNQEENNLVEKHITNKYYFQGALYRIARGSRKWVPPDYRFCNKKEKELNWTEELDEMITKRLPLEIRQQITKPEHEFQKSLTSLIELSIQQQMLQQLNEQVDLENSTHLFAFGRGLFSSIVHYLPYNIGSRRFQVAKCSGSGIFRPVDKTDLETLPRGYFCKKCFSIHKRDDDQAFRDFLQKAEQERKDDLHSYMIGKIIVNEITENELLKQPIEEFKRQLLHEKSPLLEELKRIVNIYVKLMPKELRKSARKMEIIIWGQKVY
jgi:hypothetical protein